MKFRQAKKIVHGNSSVHKKFHKRRPPYKEFFNGKEHVVYPSLHDIDIIRRAMKTYLHHYKRHKKRERGA